MIKKSLSHRITAISMALLLLVSSTGFSMDVHYCQDQLKKISFFGKATSCHEKQSTPACHKTKKTCHHKANNLAEADEDNCCHNETIVIEKSDVEAPSPQLAMLQDTKLEFVALVLAAYIFNYNVESDFHPDKFYKQPVPDRDIQVLYQTFLT